MTTAAPADPKQALTDAVAKELVGNIDNLGKSMKDLAATVESLKSELKKRGEQIDAFDTPGILKKYEEMRAGFQRISETIRTSKHGAWVPGLEEAGKRFSIVRAMCAIRTGDWKGAEFEKETMEACREKAAQVSDIGERGGWFVADQIIPEVIAAIYTKSVFVALSPDAGTTRVSVVDGMTGQSGKIPKVIGGVVAYWIGQEDAYAESQMKTGDVNFKLKKLGVLIRLTQEMRRFGGLGYETLLRQDMIRAMSKKLDWTVMYGPGTDDSPRGVSSLAGVKRYSCKTGALVTAAAGPSAPDDVGDEFNFDDVDEMIGTLEDQDYDLDGSEALISNPRLFRRIRRLRVANYSGQSDMLAYLLGIPRLSDARLQEIIGAFGKSTQIKTDRLPGQSAGFTTTSVEAKFGDVFYGRWSDVVLARGLGVDIEDDAGKGKGFTSDHIYMKMRGWFDLGYRHEASIVHCPDARMKS